MNIKQLEYLISQCKVKIKYVAHVLNDEQFLERVLFTFPQVTRPLPMRETIGCAFLLSVPTIDYYKEVAHELKDIDIMVVGQSPLDILATGSFFTKDQLCKINLEPSPDTLKVDINGTPVYQVVSCKKMNTHYVSKEAHDNE